MVDRCFLQAMIPTIGVAVSGSRHGFSLTPLVLGCWIQASLELKAAPPGEPERGNRRARFHDHACRDDMREGVQKEGKHYMLIFTRPLAAMLSAAMRSSGLKEPFTKRLRSRNAEVPTVHWHSNCTAELRCERARLKIKTWKKTVLERSREHPSP